MKILKLNYLTMKNQLNFRLLLLPTLIMVLVMSVFKCTHEDEILGDIIDSTFEYGDDMVKVSEGFNFDHTHSSVRWETAYFGTSALLTGRFNDFTFSIEFDEDNPENTSLNGGVVLSTVNTGEPGRDAGCLLGTFGVSESDTAFFSSTTVEKDGSGGYNVKGDFTFHGVTDDIVGKLVYTGTTLQDRGDTNPDNDFFLAGFVMEFDIQAKTIYGIVSGNIADRVHIICSGQFKK
jgi:polyisoprenoid-binding protein YceI